MMSYGSYYNFSFQLCSLILLALPVICLGISYKVFMKEKNTNELTLFIQAIGVGSLYGLILAVIALLSRNQLSIGGGFLSSGYSLIYGVGFISVLFRGFLLGFLSILYIGTKKEYEESNIYLGIFKQSIKTVALGYLIVFVLLVIGHLIGLSYVYEFGISNSISNINVFVVIMASLSIFTYVNINGGSLLGYNIAMNTNVILTLIMSFIYSFIVTFVGFKLSNWD